MVRRTSPVQTFFIIRRTRLLIFCRAKFKKGLGRSLEATTFDRCVFQAVAEWKFVDASSS
jgi:hypothetical protein